MSVRPIDRFIGALHRDNGDELMIESGKSIRIRFGGVERNMLAQEVRTHQIDNLVCEAVPADLLRRWRQDGRVEFPYASPTGPVLFSTERRGNHLNVTIKSYVPEVAQRAVGADEFVLESPLDDVMSRSDHGMAIVAGRPASVQPSTAVGASPAPGLRHMPSSSAPMELEMDSICPAPLPSDAFMPIAPAAPTGRVAQPGVFPPPPEGGMFIERTAHETRPERAPASSGGHHAAMDLIEEVPADLPRPRKPILREVTPPPAAAPPRRRPQSPPRHSSLAPAPASTKRASISARRSVPTDGSNQIDPLLRVLVDAGGSDLHLTARMPPRMRVDGDIGPVPGYESVLDSETIEQWLMQIAAPQYEEKFYADNDSDYAHEIDGVARFRVNAFVDRRGVGGVMRVIPSQVLTAEQLGLPPVVRNLCELDKGMVLVTGPTGSGKSTTLAAMVDLINKSRTDHIITIEDPVEFVHEPQKCLVNQREVYSHTKSFSSALKAALREDPDIVLVGEMRDLETIAIAIETAETGHLVFGTLHTNTAVSTIDRIIDQFPADREKQIRVMMSEALRGVIAQTLCKKIGGGRVAALEILVAVPAVANLIREGKTFQIPSIIQTGKMLGMQTISEALVNLVKSKTIAPEEAYRRAIKKTEMRALLERAGHRMDQ